MTIDSISSNSYARLSSMQKINSAADDAAGLAISQKMTAQTNGYEQGAANALSMQDLANTAEGSLSSMQDNLQRIRELAVEASNGTLSDSDKQDIQDEVNQLKSEISDDAKNTQFNSMSLLDGTFTNKNIAVNPSGTGMMMNMQNTSLQTLGIANFDVTGSFDISGIDNAIDKVSKARSNLGATSNAISSAVNVDWQSEQDLTAANSRIVDADVGTETTNLNIQKILEQYRMFAQKQGMQQKANVLDLVA